MTFQNITFLVTFTFHFIDSWLAPIDCNGLSGQAHYMGSRRYDYGPGGLTWDQARSQCRGRGGEALARTRS